MRVEVQMRQRFVMCLTGFALVTLVVVPAWGQTAAKPATTPTAKSWTPPKTADGQPDLQGIWDFRTVTPMERPADLKDKAFLTEQEAADYEKKIAAQRNVDANRDKTV